MEPSEAETRDYECKHDLDGVFRGLTAALLYHQPLDVRSFLVTELNRLSQNGCQCGLSDKREFAIRFRAMDVSEMGCVARNDALRVLNSLAVSPLQQQLVESETLPESVSETEFVAFASLMSEKLISFNRTSLEVLGGGESGGKGLMFTPWNLWEKPVSAHSNDHDHYASATRCLSRMTNVEEFWKYWLCVPQPSELLEGKHFVRETDAATGALTQIDTLMLFREGVRPEWEDPANATGGHVQFLFKMNGINPSQLDEYWNNIAMGLVGGAIQYCDMVTGIRLLDKSTVGRNNGVRIEVWFRDYHHTDKIALLRQSIETCMATRLDGSVGPLPKSELKSHTS